MTTCAIPGSISSNRAEWITDTASAVRPAFLWKRLVILSVIGVLGFLGIIATLVVIALGLPQSEPARVVALGVFLTAFTLTFLACLAVCITISRAFLYQYVRRLEAEDEVAEATRHLNGGLIVMTSLMAWRHADVRAHLQHEIAANPDAQEFLEMCEEAVVTRSSRV